MIEKVNKFLMGLLMVIYSVGLVLLLVQSLRGRL